jgi:hypothetical protein
MKVQRYLPVQQARGSVVFVKITRVQKSMHSGFVRISLKGVVDLELTSSEYRKYVVKLQEQ